MEKIIFWGLIALSIVDAIVSLILGHVNQYYNPRVTASLNGFVASAIAISLVVLLSINKDKQYMVRTKIPILAGIGIIAILSLSFQFALGFYFGGWGCAIWLLAALYGILPQKPS